MSASCGTSRPVPLPAFRHQATSSRLFPGCFPGLVGTGFLVRLGPVTKQLCQPLSNVRGSDALSEPRTLESGCRRMDWLFPDGRLGNRAGRQMRAGVAIETASHLGIIGGKAAGGRRSSAAGRGSVRVRAGLPESRRSWLVESGYRRGGHFAGRSAAIPKGVTERGNASGLAALLAFRTAGPAHNSLRKRWLLP